MSHGPRMHVTVAWSSGPRQVTQVSLTLDTESSVQQALQAADAPTGEPFLVLAVGARKSNLEHILRDGDRVELLRPLRVDPKLARRERFAKQGARTSGLFATRRPGSKPGY